MNQIDFLRLEMQFEIMVSAASFAGDYANPTRKADLITMNAIEIWTGISARAPVSVTIYDDKTADPV